MTLVTPTVPQAGDTAEASDVSTPINQLAAVINGNIDDNNISSVSGTKIVSATVPTTALQTNANPETFMNEGFFPYVASGCVLSGTGYGSTLAWSMTAGVVYINGRRLTVASATGTVTASKDTYFDVLDPGTGSVATLVNTGGNIVTNNAASPALAANSIRIGIIVSGASNIASVASVNQGQENKLLPIASSIPYAVTDSLGNLICPRDPSRKTLGYRRLLSTFATALTTNPIFLSVPVIVPVGRKVKISCGAKTMLNSGNYYAVPRIWDGAPGGTQLAESSVGAVANLEVPLYFEVEDTPAVASKTYTGTLATSNALGTASLTASSVSPIFVRVDLV